MKNEQISHDADFATLGGPGAGRGEQQLVWRPAEGFKRPEPAAVHTAGLRHHHLANTAYPIAHRKTIWQHRVDPGQHGEILRQALLAAPRMSLYAHVPFCEKRCRFCEYTVLEQHSAGAELRYFEALQTELSLYLELLGRGACTLAGFDIGGGTPALVETPHIASLVEAVHAGFKLGEGYGISIETTPKIAALQSEKLRAYKAMGIDRISMGLQMANPRLLREYGRDLNAVTFNSRAVEHIRAAGFSNFNIDVMYGFAKQDVEDLRLTLEHTIALDPEVITLYRMRYKGTRVRGEAAQVELAKVTAMYQLARELLAGHGYRANPGKNGFSRVADDPGTSPYLTERVMRSTPYLGIGLGAQTFTNNALGYNLGAATKRVEGYLQSVDAGELPLQDLYWLPRSEATAKMVSVAFYFGEVHKQAFASTFGLPLQQAYPEALEFVLEHGLMIDHGDRISLSEKGAKEFNGVIALFYSPRVQEHLLSL